MAHLLVIRRLRSLGYNVLRKWVRQAIRSTDPLNTALRWHGVTVCRPYSILDPCGTLVSTSLGEHFQTIIKLVSSQHQTSLGEGEGGTHIGSQATCQRLVKLSSDVHQWLGQLSRHVSNLQVHFSVGRAVIKGQGQESGAVKWSRLIFEGQKSSLTQLQLYTQRLCE